MEKKKILCFMASYFELVINRKGIMPLNMPEQQ